MRRIAALMDTDGSNPEGQARIAAFRQGLQQRGWAEGRNIRIDLRWGGGDVERARGFAAELVHLSPDVIFGAQQSGYSAFLEEVTPGYHIASQRVLIHGIGSVARAGTPLSCRPTLGHLSIASQCGVRSAQGLARKSRHAGFHVATAPGATLS